MKVSFLALIFSVVVLNSNTSYSQENKKSKPRINLVKVESKTSQELEVKNIKETIRAIEVKMSFLEADGKDKNKDWLLKLNESKIALESRVKSLENNL